MIPKLATNYATTKIAYQESLTRDDDSQTQSDLYIQQQDALDLLMEAIEDALTSDDNAVLMALRNIK